MHQCPQFVFVIKPYMFRASSVPIISGYPLYTRQLVRFMQAMWPVEFQTDSATKRSHNLHETYQLPCVQWITADDGHRRCPKHVGFYDKNKLWTLMHLVCYFYETKWNNYAVAHHPHPHLEGSLLWRTGEANVAKWSPRAMPTVAYLLVRPAILDRSNVMAQTKRDTLLLQVGEWAWCWHSIAWNF